jgi:DNA-directed RNA polymerase specialized sigma24 family protein
VRPDFVGGGFSTAGSRTMCGWTRGPLGRPPRSSLFAKRARAVTAKPSNHGRMATNPDHDVARETRCAGLMSDLAGSQREAVELLKLRELSLADAARLSGRSASVLKAEIRSG